MKDQEFERLEAEFKNRPVPNCPPDMEVNVLRRVRSAQSIDESGWSWLNSLILRPTFAAAALTVVVATSLSASLVSIGIGNDHHPQSIRTALDFTAFSSKSVLQLDRK